MEVEDHCDQKKRKGKCKREKEKEEHELWNRDSDGSNGVMGIIFKADGDEIRRRNRRSDGLRNLPDIERQAFFCFLYLSSLLVFFSLITEETRYIYIYIWLGHWIYIEDEQEAAITVNELENLLFAIFIMAQSLFRFSIPLPLLALLDADEVIDGKNYNLKS